MLGELEDDNHLQQKSEEQVQLPDYAEVEGEQIKLAGLDYRLLQQEREREAKDKKGFLSHLKTKLNIISGNVLDRVVTEEKVIANDPHFNQIKDALESKNHDRKEEKVQIFYEFNLDELGERQPRKVMKRLGKMTKKPVFVHFDEEFFEGLSHSFAKVTAEEDHDCEMEEEEKENDSDDIFGDCGSEKQIQVGKKLDFGMEDDIFAEKRDKPVTNMLEEELINEERNDKYFFMRKRVKKNGLEDDGYGECYYQSGPSLNELAEMKKLGIEYYGDAKQFKQKQKKAPNIHQEYNKIQKIIDKKNKA